MYQQGFQAATGNPSGISAQQKQPLPSGSAPMPAPAATSVPEVQPDSIVAVSENTAANDSDNLWLIVGATLSSLALFALGSNIYVGRRDHNSNRNNNYGLARGRQEFGYAVQNLNQDDSWGNVFRGKLPPASTNSGAMVPHSNRIESDRDFNRGSLRGFTTSQRNYANKHPRYRNQVLGLESQVDPACLESTNGNNNVALVTAFLTALTGLVSTLGRIGFKVNKKNNKK